MPGAPIITWWRANGQSAAVPAAIEIVISRNRLASTDGKSC